MAVSIDLGGKVILVCGAARGGIGGAAARTLAAAGGTVVAVDITQALLDETIADIEGAGGRCTGIEADLLDPASSRRIIDAIEREHGRLDAVVNVAGGTRPHQWRPLETSPDRDLDDVFGFNLGYVFRICRDAAALMIEQGRAGSLVNTASVSAGLSAPQHGFYGASKSAIIALTRTMSAEWGPRGIRANTVSPGPVLTARLMAQVPPDSGMDLSRFTATTEVANAMLFLVSDLASGVSGRDIVVDRGLSASFAAK